MEVVLARKVLDRYLDADSLRAVSDLFRRHVEAGLLKRLPLTSVHADAVGDLVAAAGLPLRTLDALHLVVAKNSADEIATFDSRLGAAAVRLGLRVLPALP